MVSSPLSWGISEADKTANTMNGRELDASVAGLLVRTSSATASNPSLSAVLSKPADSILERVKPDFSSLLKMPAFSTEESSFFSSIRLNADFPLSSRSSRKSPVPKNPFSHSSSYELTYTRTSTRAKSVFLSRSTSRANQINAMTHLLL